MTLTINEDAVRTFARKKNWKIVDVAKAAGLSYSTVYRAISGANFDSKTLEKIAEALGVNPLDLLAVENEPSPLVGAQAVACLS